MTPRLKINLWSKTFHSFHFFGVIGFLAGLALGISLTLSTGLSLGITLLLSTIGAIAFFGLTWIWKVFTGEENIVYYQHEIFILFLCSLTLWLMGKPVLTYLDITLMGIGLFLAFGRWGCFSVGCCHGKPSKFGVIYSQDHADAGFPFYYVGIKIFSMPLVESGWVLCTVMIGSVLIIKGMTPGTALVWYTVIYGTARFFFEFFRGDPERPYWKGFSEAQWTTLALLELSVLLGYLEILPFYWWHFAAGVGLLLYMIGLAIYRNSQQIPTYKYLNPKHINEIAYSLQKIENSYLIQKNNTNPIIPIACTSHDLCISMGKIPTLESLLSNYTISFKNTRKQNKENKSIKINLKIAQQIADLIQLLHQRDKIYEIKKGRKGIYHILFHPNKSKKVIELQK